MTTDNRWLHIIYGFYAVTFFLGFAFIVGVGLAYWLRGYALSDMQRSHIDWQIRTFWWTLLFTVIGFVLSFLLGSALIGMLVFGLMLVWYFFRVVKGWLRLKDGRAIDDPTALI